MVSGVQEHQSEETEPSAVLSSAGIVSQWLESPPRPSAGAQDPQGQASMVAKADLSSTVPTWQEQCQHISPEQDLEKIHLSDDELDWKMHFTVSLEDLNAGLTRTLQKEHINFKIFLTVDLAADLLTKIKKFEVSHELSKAGLKKRKWCEENINCKPRRQMK